LGLAALGIVLRGSGFAFRKAAVGLAGRQAAGAAFASSSVITPFFFGTVAGGIASGRVPAAGAGAAVRSWVNPTSFLGGTLAVVVCAYLAAVFLTAEARARSDDALEAWFRRRAFAAAGVAGGVALTGVFVLRADAGRLSDHLLGDGLPLLVVSGAAGLSAVVLIARGSLRGVRLLATAAVAAVVAG